MKTKTTRNQLKKYFNNIISVPYCRLNKLLSYEDAIFYNAGINGWNYDVYSINGDCIVTGYNTFGTPAPGEIIAAYEAKAKEIKESSRDYTATKAALYGLLVSFIQEVIDTATK